MADSGIEACVSYCFKIAVTATKMIYYKDI